MKLLTDYPTKCNECESEHLSWGSTATNRGCVVDGRIRMHEVGVLFYLCCKECSHTIATVDGNDIAKILTDIHINQKTT